MKKKVKTKKEKNKTRIFLLLQGVFVVGILFYLYFSSTPKAVLISGQSIVEPDISFSVSPGEKIIVSRDPEFINPIILEEGTELNLPPGVYYWKSKTLIRESEVKTFEIKENVGINLRIGDEKSILENSGNVEIDVEKQNKGITSGISLDVDESVEVEKEADYEAKKK